MQEFQIQSNIPVLIITIALIVITVIGFLEFKKISNRIDSIMSNIESMRDNGLSDLSDNNSLSDNNGLSDNNDLSDNNENLDLSAMYKMGEPVQEGKSSVMKDDYEEEYEVNNEKQEISQVREYTENASADSLSTKQLFITKNINPNDFIIDKTNTSNEIEEIDSNSDSYSDSDRSSDYSDETTSVVSEHSEKGGILNISEIIDSKPEDKDVSETVQDLLNGVEGEELDKGLNDTITSDNKSLINDESLMIDESMSVNQLKQICKDKGLSVSGSKSKLISRIKENQ
jgi:uncharacterized protein YoxC